MSDSSVAAAGLHRHSRRPVTVLALLGLALLVVVLIYSRDLRLSRFRADSGYTFVTDIDRWRRTHRERIIRARYDFSLGPQLHDIPLTLGEWQGADIPQSNIEVQILLEPEEYVYRRYRRSDGRYLWLSIIGSRQAKSFHAPQICYDADGWQTNVSSVALALAEGEVYAMQLLAEKDDWQHVVTYFYLYPDFLRESAGGTVLFKLTAPLEGSLEETFELQEAFAQTLFLGSVSP